jgi:predicted metal-binding membrane protein
MAVAARATADTRQRVFAPLFFGLIGLAWFALWAWAASPWGRYLDHGDWTLEGPAAAWCRTLPGGTWLVPALLYASAWVLMTAAMMLPSTWPLLRVFDRVLAARADRGRLLALLGLGYVAVWAAFGLLAHALHAALLEGVAAWPLLARRGELIGATVVFGAGAFQFSALKHRCLDKCRTPMSFVMSHWRGRAPAHDALRLGAHHGLFCVGCCWALMLLMFLVGAGSLGWMLLLAAAMAVEKNFAWGQRLSTPLGLALLAWGGALALG